MLCLHQLAISSNSCHPYKNMVKTLMHICYIRLVYMYYIYNISYRFVSAMSTENVKGKEKKRQRLVTKLCPEKM